MISSSVEVIAITESWLNDRIYDNEILPQNQYTISRLDRGSRGGGVMLGIKQDILSKVLPSPHGLEVLTIQIGIRRPIILCLVYLQPSSSISENEPLFKHISDLCSGSSPVVILRDFNLPDINWNTLSGNSSLANVFCELVFELNLLQLIECPTHIHGNILDLILTNTDDLIQNVVVLPHNLCPVQSDHFLINFSMSISEHSLSNITPHYVYDYSKADFEGLDAYIFNSNLLECLTSQDVEYV